ncbi:hypothetical protein JAAARDRAFT_62633 [Jaapia argillacea MUCL 33604]|uniref:Protein-S-isoprenylcysteine O-methyltransferase n=1 Tax=Jaapia argillacea MUCL 33604 TaxID=933084 RepID=A0A067P8V3_9AGAM|nr:hypothetical protein JAAARDRAFT_62633 [Jaapia argillacea MUCL 33604]
MSNLTIHAFHRILYGWIATFSITLCMSPPNPPAPPSEQQRFNSWERSLGNHIYVVPAVTKLAFWFVWLLETTALIARQFPWTKPIAEPTLSLFVQNPLSSLNAIRVTPVFLAGSVLAAIGGYIRYRCYEELGRLFTYELTIRKNHKLVTDGMYSFVRHPSYTGGILAFTGYMMTAFTQGSWLRESGALETFVGKAFAYATLLLASSTYVYSVFRVRTEDRILRAEFGAQWDEWAKRVPYRLVPYIY